MNKWLALALALPSALWAVSLEDYGYVMPIQVPAGSGLARIVLPREVYQASVSDRLWDLRVFDNRGNAVPMAREPRREEHTEGAAFDLLFYPIYGQASATLEGSSVRIQRQGTQIDVSMGDGPARGAGSRVVRGYLVDLATLSEPLVSMRFLWRHHGDSQLLRVNLDSSEDLSQWTRVLEGGALASMQYNGQRLLRDSVGFAPIKPKYMRITFQSEGVLPELTGVRGRQGRAMVEAARQWKEVTPVQAGGDNLEFDLGGPFPVDRMQLLSAAENVVLPVEISSRAHARDPWSVGTPYTFYRLQQGGHSITNPDVILPGARHGHWRLRVSGAGSIPAAARLRLGWAPESLVFVVQGEPPFRLAYGNARAEDPWLPIESLVPGYGGERAPLIAAASLGARQELSGPKATARRADIKTVALWSALVVGVLLLAWMALSLAKQMKK